MKVAVLSESAGDEAAVRILVEAMLGEKTTPVGPPTLRSRGWPSVLTVVPAVVRHLYYQTDADALVIVVDSDDSAIHDVSHAGQGSGDCRYCRLERQLAELQQGLRSAAPRSPFRIAIGLAVPCIEAWYLTQQSGRMSELIWAAELRERKGLRDKRLVLKRDVYATDRPSLIAQTRIAIEAAIKVAANLSLLERQFPQGFGALSAAVRSWRG